MYNSGFQIYYEAPFVVFFLKLAQHTPTTWVDVRQAFEVLLVVIVLIESYFTVKYNLNQSPMKFVDGRW